MRYMFCSSDKNIPGANMAMSKARKIVEYFSKSTQQTSKLLKFQKESNLQAYSGHGFRPLKLLQDVVTRWWSSYRMLKRLRLLKPALMCLHSAKEITCDMLETEQWVVLEQIEITLKKIATWQRILEGEKYPTGSLVVSAIYAIRAHYVNILNSEHALEPVKSLTRTLLEDFDKRYHPPADNVGKVKFTEKPETGERNRYTGVHPYFFYAAFLDPSVRKGLRMMMVPVQLEELREMILARMINVALEKETHNNNNDRNEANSNDKPTGTGASDGIDFAFEGLFDHSDDDGDLGMLLGRNTNEESIRIRCKNQLDNYELTASMKMRDNEGNFNDALKYWAANESQSPELAQLAKEFLTIPATSAPSERVWSRAARVIRAKRSHLNPDVTARMMFAQENSELIREHWKVLQPDVPFLEYYLPPPVDEDGNPIDVGQNDNDYE